MPHLATQEMSCPYSVKREFVKRFGLEMKRMWNVKRSRVASCVRNRHIEALV